jgi:hypothetical protein
MNIYSLLNGASIATSNTVSQSLLSASLTDIAFDFSTPVNIDAEMSIFFGISRTGSLDGTNFYLIGTDTNDTYNQGNEIHTTSGVWSYGAFDLYFEIYSGGSPSPLINALSTDLTGFTEDADGIYPSGTEVTYTVQTALTPGITYYWRVRAKDPLGSNTWGAWSPGSGSLGYQSFTVEAGVSGPTTDQQMRHGTWFNNNVKQPFTF